MYMLFFYYCATQVVLFFDLRGYFVQRCEGDSMHVFISYA
jgi:L-fucose isomerase-like protein